MNKHKGFTLIEILLVLAIIAALSVVAFIVYPRVQAGRQATNNTSILNAGAATLTSVFPSGRYGNLTATVACNADVFPETFLVTPGDCAGGIQNEWEGAVDAFGSDETGTLVATSAARYFTIVFNGVPSKVCNKLAAAAASNFGRVGVGDNQAAAIASPIVDIFADATDTVDEAAMTAACNNAPEVSIAFTSK